jgi:hypothetical protein
MKKNNRPIILLGSLIVILIVLLISLAGCENLEMSKEGDVKLVLNAYLYEDEPVTHIRLSESLPFTSDENVFPPIADASISIQWKDGDFSLLSSDSAGFYHCPDSNLKIISGESYAIKIVHGEDVLSAATTVPPKPDSMMLSATQIEIDPEMTPWEMRQAGIADIEVTWSNADWEYFYVLVENIEEDPEDIEFGFSGFGGMRPNFRFLSRPFITDTYIIRVFLSVQQYGTHRVKLFRVNQEYADLYENREQDSRNLTEPLSNVKNGLGIFTAFSYDEAFFEVVKK